MKEQIKIGAIYKLPQNTSVYSEDLQDVVMFTEDKHLILDSTGIHGKLLYLTIIEPNLFGPLKKSKVECVIDDLIYEYDSLDEFNESEIIKQ